MKNIALNKGLLIDKSYTLFLDRDGVINRRVVGNYVIKPEEFELLPGVGEAIAGFNDIFGNVIVVTNQQGVQRGLMTENDLHLVHHHMLDLIAAQKANINRIYYCTELSETNSFFRKPNVGMALKARKDFPEIKFSKSVMVGDSVSDMLFGKRLGMMTVFIAEDDYDIGKYHKLIDIKLKSLLDFYNLIK